jgi:hypothetical protein
LGAGHLAFTLLQKSLFLTNQFRTAWPAAAREREQHRAICQALGSGGEL